MVAVHISTVYITHISMPHLTSPIRGAMGVVQMLELLLNYKIYNKQLIIHRKYVCNRSTLTVIRKLWWIKLTGNRYYSVGNVGCWNRPNDSHTTIASVIYRPESANISSLWPLHIKTDKQCIDRLVTEWYFQKANQHPVNDPNDAQSCLKIAFYSVFVILK